MDDWMFDVVYQRFANWFQGLTGLSNFFLVRSLIVINCAVQTAYNATDQMLVGAFLPNALILIIGFFVVRFIESSISNSRGTSLAMNMWRKDPFVSSIRELLLLFTIYSLARNAYEFGVGGEWSARSLFTRLEDISQLYLMSCTPLPPGESKFRKWLNARKESFSGGMVPQPSSG